MTCDQPLISPESLQRLIATRSELAAAGYADTVGIPALFARSFFDELLTLADDEGAKKILISHAETLVKVAMPEAATDIDTPADLAKLQENGLRQSR